MTDKKYAHRIPSLMDEQPINFYPHLAEILGVNEAIVLQQIWFYINVNRQNESERHFHDGKWWVYNSYKQWNARYFPWLNPRAIQVVILNLEKLNILESMQGVEDKYDRRKWYTVNLKALEDVIQKASKDSAKSAPSSVQDLDDDNVQNLHDEIPETTTEETTEKRKEIAPASANASAPLSNPSSSSVEEPEISTPVESSTQRTVTDKDDTTPLSPSSAPPPSPKKARGVLERIIIDQWQTPYTGTPCPVEGSKGVAAFLLPQMVGRATAKSGRAEFNFDVPVTDEEVYAFGKWYRKHQPDTPMPLDAGKLAMRFEQFRTCEDYAERLKTAAHEVGILYRGKPKQTASSHFVAERTPISIPSDHPVAHIFAKLFPNEEQF